jgi:hypothetical protein
MSAQGPSVADADGPAGVKQLDLSQRKFLRFLLFFL